MRVLLDTHIILWFLCDDQNLSGEAKRIILEPGNAIYVSDISFWEIQLKVMSGKLDVDLQALIHQLPMNNFLILAMNMSHILTLAKLPSLHKDPFDRMLIAQALTEPLHLLTHDQQVAAYSDAIILV
jgi:PIN domain nuclease of toxin-antitoxin system